MTYEVEQLDATDDAQWAAWHDCYVEASLHGSPYADVLTADSERVSFTRAGLDQQVTGWQVRDGVRVLGVARVHASLMGNTHLADGEVLVRAGDRRRGIGTALLRRVEQHLRDDGRTTFVPEVVVADGAPREEQAGVGFATRHGYARAHAETHFVADVPPSEAELDALQALVDERIGSYRMVSFGARTPDDLMDDYCRLLGRFLELAPIGDLDLVPETWTPERVRDVEDRRIAKGQKTFTTVAVAPDGGLVGATDLVRSPSVRGGVHQNATLVLPQARGHRLGLAVKLANLRTLVADDPTPALVHTWNAGENAPMLAVNARLGFRAVGTDEEWQRRLV